MEVASNIQPKKFGLNVRRNGPQPSIFVRSFSPITTRIKMCLIEKEESNIFLQGGTYD
jgi:hypothetical protein